MPLPRSNMKINKKGLQYTSDIDRASYTIKELSRAALRDVARLIKYEMAKKIRTLPGMRKSRRASKAVGIWLRSIEGDLQIGMGNTKKGTSGDTWYGIQAELGTKNQPKRGFLRETVYENIGKIREIEARYLSSIEDENRALALIDEEEVIE